jgi:hypothetical protein
MAVTFARFPADKVPFLIVYSNQSGGDVGICCELCDASGIAESHTTISLGTDSP